MRNFGEVYNSICNLLPEELAQKLKNKAPYWAPEYVWAGLAEFVQNNIAIDSTDELAIKVYAVLCGTTEEEMKAKMIASNF